MAEKNYVIGVDAGGTKVAYGLFDGEGILIDRMEHPSDQDADGPAFSDRMITSVDELLSRNALTRDQLKGVGVCICSYVFYETGYIYLTSALEKIQNFPMRDYLQERLGVKVELDNDANVAALAEYRRGAGRGAGKHMVYFTVSTGIGSGIIINGEVFHGTYGFAGECGHMLMTPDEGLWCGCGNQGCYMSWGSGLHIPQHTIKKLDEGRVSSLAQVDRSVLSGRELLAACKEGDALALEMLDQMARTIGICVFNIYQMLNINWFVFGGGLTAFGDMLFDRVRAVFDRYNHIDLPVEFRVAELQKDFGIIGAAEMIS